MPEVVATGGNGSAVQVSRARSLIAPGAGQFVSKNGYWYAALIPITTPQRNPINPERWIDVPVLDANGTIKMQLDPAAVESLRAMTEGQEDRTRIKVMQFSEPANEAQKHADAINSQLASLRETMMELGKQNAATLQQLTLALTAAISGAAPKKNPVGRPPKASTAA